jgi:hypothetical protein
MRQTEWVDASNPQTSVEPCEAAHGTTGSTSMTAAEAGGATNAVMIEPGEEILVGDGRKRRVLPVDEEASPFFGLLRVEPA